MKHMEKKQKYVVSEDKKVYFVSMVYMDMSEFEIIIFETKKDGNLTAPNFKRGIHSESVSWKNKEAALIRFYQICFAVEKGKFKFNDRGDYYGGMSRHGNDEQGKTMASLLRMTR